MMRFLIASALLMSNTAFAEQRFELVGFIKAQISKTEDRSIVVLRDQELQKTLFLRVGDKLPGSKWTIEKMERNSVTLGDGSGDSMRLNTQEATASNEEDPTFSMNTNTQTHTNTNLDAGADGDGNTNGNTRPEVDTDRTLYTCRDGRCSAPAPDVPVLDVPLIAPIVRVENGSSELPTHLR